MVGRPLYSFFVYTYSVSFTFIWIENYIYWITLCIANKSMAFSKGSLIEIHQLYEHNTVRNRWIMPNFVLSPRELLLYYTYIASVFGVRSIEITSHYFPALWCSFDELYIAEWNIFSHLISICCLKLKQTKLITDIGEPDQSATHHLTFLLICVVIVADT